MRLSVVLPLFNEQENIEPLYARLTATLDRIGCDFEIIFVDDGSRDDSLRIIERQADSDPRVKFLSLSRNFGHEVASTAGLDVADGDAVILMDADLQDPPELIEAMLDPWLRGYDVVYATRRRRRGDAVLKRAAIYLFYRLMRRVACVDLPVDTGDFRLMDRRVVEALRQFGEGQRFVRGLVSWMGFRQTAVEYDRAARHAGQGKYGVLRLCKFGMDALLGYSLVPLRIAAALGLASSLAALGTLGVAITRIMLGAAGPDATQITLMALALLGGVQLLAIGIAGEYVGRTHTEVLRRPLYLVDRQRGFDSARTIRAIDIQRRPRPIEHIERHPPLREEAA